MDLFEIPLPNAPGAVNAASHDGFYKWSYIFVFNSPMEKAQNQVQFASLSSTWKRYLCNMNMFNEYHWAKHSTLAEI